VTLGPELPTQPYDLTELTGLAGVRRPPQPVVTALGALHRRSGLVDAPRDRHSSPRTNTQWRAITAEAVIAASFSLGVEPGALLQILPLGVIQKDAGIEI
jgi:hypothetical protein